MDDAARIQTVKRHLRRTFKNDLIGLKAKCTEVAAGATEAVELTGNSFEGGSANGQLVFERLAYLQAILDILDEMDPDGGAEPPPTTTHADFSYSPLQT